ncbi:GntR family transcriptional regulator [Streptomyces sp. AN091965]|uniref:GntR family transcriptional regulator n=1 Tax=Streptomyces sp. AN091965 TaxID=2927803 RepID=UPI001F603301|nr:GntR family transcriptional regulator [Streptomyces sp. AN091965]MCI3930205.1 GntR family transcriptional regulator [Streptomyces sp. AN091965]
MSEVPTPLPPYKRIAEKIKAQIERGELLPGDPIPSAREIMRTEGISSATAARVAPTLRAEGYAVTGQGVRTVAAKPRKIIAGADRLGRLRAGGDGLDNDTVEFLGADLEPATREVADALGLDEGTQVVKRRRRYLDTLGVKTVSTTWIEGSIAERAPELLRPEALPKMTFGAIEDATGRRASRQRDTIAIREVPADVAEHLGVDAGERTLVVVNHYWDQHGEPTEYAVDYHGPGRELTREHDRD